MLFQAYANYAMGPPQVGFSFRVEPPTILYFYMIAVCFGVCFLFFRCHAGCHIHLWGLKHWGLHHCNPLELIHGRQTCNLAMVIGPHQVCIEWLLPPTALSRGSLLLLNQLSSSHSNYTVGYTALGAWQSHPIPPSSLHGGEGSSFPGLVPSGDMVNSESVVGIKPGASGVVTGYQVHEFTHTWSGEHFVAHSHIYPGCHQ